VPFLIILVELAHVIYKYHVTKSTLLMMNAHLTKDIDGPIIQLLKKIYPTKACPCPLFLNPNQKMFQEA
jgi:hypothetical protein